MKQLITTFIRTLISFIRSLFFDPPPPLPTLPFDLIEQILCRLPVNLLLQLRCQSKTLNSLISDPEFAKKHLRMSTKLLHFIPMDSSDLDSIKVISYPLHFSFNPKKIKPTELQYPPYQHVNSVYTFGSCNGILCLILEKRYRDKPDDIILWNPSIRKFKILHAPKSSQECPTLYGFGYDHVNNVYKVLAISFDDGLGDKSFKTQIMIHNLGTNYWRMIDGELPLPCDHYASLEFLYGTLNWITFKDGNKNSCVVSFDLVSELYRTLSEPNHGGDAVKKEGFGVLKDCLCIIAHRPSFSSIWLMKEYGNEESWTELFRFHHIESFYYSYITPVWIYENNQMLMRYTSSLQEDKIWIVCDFKNETFKFPKIQDSDHRFSYEVCVESLISPCF